MQVNTSAEESKFGLPPEELAVSCGSYPVRDVEGTGSDDAGPVHLRHRPGAGMLPDPAHAPRPDEGGIPDLIGTGELSMGMSGDMNWPIEEGATCVRVARRYSVPATPPTANTGLLPDRMTD